MIDMTNLLNGSNDFNGLTTLNPNLTHLINMLYGFYDPNPFRLNLNPLTSYPCSVCQELSPLVPINMLIL